MTEKEKVPELYTEEPLSTSSETSLDHVSQEASSDEVAALAHLLGHEGGEEAELDDKDFRIILGGSLAMPVSEARQIIEKTLVDHRQDRNFPTAMRAQMENVLTLDEKTPVSDGVSASFQMRALASIMKFSSPYPDVRACTRISDDPEEPCETFRAYFIGIIWVGIASFVNQFFAVRLPSISLPPSLLQLFIVPCGWFLAKSLPDWGFNFRGKRHSLNPGPWTYKEQTFVTIMFGITASLAYVDSQILVQRLPMFYSNDWAGVGYQICMLLSTQFLGFGIAGIFRNILVYPTQNLWMNQFPTMALNRSFLMKDNNNPINGWRFTRWQLFGIVFVAIFIWQWLPSYLMVFLSYFNWMTWIAPNNFNLAAITGSVDGVGFNPIPTFDYSTINFATPLQTPFFSLTNMLVGTITGGLIIIAVYYSNMYNCAYLPINSNKLFTNTGEVYQVAEILTNNVLDHDKYQAYSPPYYAAANLVLYGAFFAAYTCLYVTALLYDWKIMWESVKELYLGCIGRGKSIHDYTDGHSRMMQKYKETPQWWFLIVLVCAFGLAVATLKGFPTETPVWGLVMALGLSVIFLVPIGVLYSQTNQMMSINVLTELLIGYAKPGHGTAMMLVKAYGVNTNLQAVYFMNDLKLAHYAKVSPRAAFRAQLLATLVSGFVVFGVCQFQLTSVDGICTDAQEKTTKFLCPNENTYFSASVLWGVIGPKRVFDYQYPILKWCFLIGAAIPIPLFLVRKCFPRLRKTLLFVEPNSMIMGILNGYAPYNLSYILSGWYLNAFFMYYVRRRYTRWFEKYTYVVASALIAGTALAAFIIFFAVQYHTKDIDWWGNTVSFNGIDGTRAARLTLDEGAIFGPPPGEYPW